MTTDLAPDALHLRAIIAAQAEIARAELDLDRVMALVAERSQALTGANGAAVELAEGDEMVYRAACGSAAGFVGVRLRRDASLSGYCVGAGEVVRCDDVALDPRVDLDACRRIGVASMIVTPLFNDGRVVGVLKVLAPRPHAFDDRDVQTLWLMAELIGTAIARAADAEARQALLAERSAALARMQESEARFHSAFAAAAIGKAIVGLDGRWLEVNDALCGMLGYAAAELQRLDFQQITHPDDLDADLRLVERLLAGELPHYHLEKRYRRRTGEMIWVLLSVSLVRGRDGAPRYFIAQVQDISDRRRAEDELRATADALTRSNRELEEFAYVASHDLRAPLVSLAGLAGILDDDYGPALDAEGRRLIERVRANAAKMQRLLDDLLALSRARQIAAPAALEPCALDPLVRGVLDELGALLAARDAEARVLTPLPTVPGMAGQLERVVSNLIENAINYTPPGRSPRVEIAARELPDTWELVFRDYGAGIPPERREQVFGMFQRLPEGARANPGGTGMGLAIVARIVAAHGGRCWIGAVEGDGTAVHIALPKAAPGGVAG